MNVASLFTGVGGIDLGLERAGMRVVLQCEQDRDCQRVLRRHWPGVPLFDDVREVGADWFLRGESAVGGARDGCGTRSDRASGIDPDPVHLVCGGFPCQDLSISGNRAGLAGERSGLFFEAARVADALLGDGGWLLIENVPGLFSSNGGRDFAVILATLAELGFHDLAWRVLDSRYFGVPQRRRRVFILARRATGDGARSVLLEPESGGGDHQAGAQARQRVAASLSSGSSSPGVSSPGRRQEDDSNIVGTLDRADGGADDNDALAGHIVGDRWQPEQVGTLRSGFHDLGLDTPEEYPLVAPALTAEGHDASEDGTGRQCIVSGTLRSNGRNNSNPGTHAASLVAATDADREGEAPGLPGRLDPSLWPAACPVEARPDSPREAQTGNAVTVQVAEWIGRRMMTYEGGEL